jgi:alanine dehydrogenase
MIIGIPRELKLHEYRVGLTPVGARELTSAGHRVLVETNAGEGSGFTDDAYVLSGAEIIQSAADVWAAAELMVKVKEPIEVEFAMMRSGQVLFTYLHLAADRPVTEALLVAEVTAIAYETVQLASGALPLLAPMSEVAGRMASQVGAALLQHNAGGTGVLMGGIAGVPAAKVVVLGAGVAGMSAAAIALGMQADVTILDRNIEKLKEAVVRFGPAIRTLASTMATVEESCLQADLVIGAVLIPGATAPRLVSHELVTRMRPGSVLVDIAIDQGGCFEDSRATSHNDPTFTVAGSTFYCVANMPGAYPRTSTTALTNLTLPYIIAIAGRGWTAALAADPVLAGGLSTHAGLLVNPDVAEAHALPFTPIEQILAPVGIVA